MDAVERRQWQIARQTVIDRQIDRQADAARRIAEGVEPIPVIIDHDGVELVTVPAAAKLTQQGVRTIYNWISRGLVEVRLTPTGHKRVVVSSLFKTQETAAPVPAAEESTT